MDNLPVDLPPSPLLPNAQKELISEINSTGRQASGSLLHAQFVANAQEFAERIALVTPTETFTYGELLRVSTRLADELIRRGVRPGDLIGIVMLKGWEQIAGALAVLMAGGAYVPLEPDWPEERLLAMLKESGTELILTQSALATLLPIPEGVASLHADEWEEARSQDFVALDDLSSPEDPAYVIYTSGSSGRPKGVVMAHRAASNTISDINERFEVGGGDRVLGISSLSFDLSVYDMFGTLSAGATLVLPPPGSQRRPRALWDVLESERITIWNSVPALLELLLDCAPKTASSPPDISPLRLALLSGDWIPLRLPDALRAHVPTCEMVSLGGATEAAIWSVIFPIDKVEPDWVSIPYGWPMKNQRLYILNERLQLCPVCVPGGIYIGGVGLAIGYWDNKEATDASFIRHPVTDERLYRTGDVGRYRTDGTIEFLGREDGQLKVHGNRIESAEVEAALCSYPSIAKAAVTLSAVAPPRLVAFLVTYDSDIDTRALRDYLMQKLPRSCVPASFTCLRELPLTSNGKVDRGRLRKLADTVGRPSPTDAAGEALSTSEQMLLQSVREMTEDADLSMATRILDLSVDSMVLVRLANRWADDFGELLELKYLLDNPSLREIADHLSANSTRQ